MKASTLIFVAGAALVSAQCDTSKIPTCAKGPIDTAIASVCSSSTDYKCACGKQEALTGAATATVLSACGADVALSKLCLWNHGKLEELVGLLTASQIKFYPLCKHSALPSTRANVVVAVAAAPPQARALPARLLALSTPRSLNRRQPSQVTP